MRKEFIFILSLWLSVATLAQQTDTLRHAFSSPDRSARPWVFWYWMHGAVSRAGITADLEAMREAGIGGAYLMPIKDTLHRLPFRPFIRQGSTEWWSMLRFAFEEAKRLDLRLGMHVSDGFALAGGPWISPERSMQKLTWSTLTVHGQASTAIKMPLPPIRENHYRDIAVFAYPMKPNGSNDLGVHLPIVTASDGSHPNFLAAPARLPRETFRNDTSAWIQYAYDQPLTMRSLRIHTGGNNYQSQRLALYASTNGHDYRLIRRIEPPRHGWQDTDEDYTYSIPPVTARYFRFVYDRTGTEPGSEDLDAAKWKPVLRIRGIWPSSDPVIDGIEGKNGAVWRLSPPTNPAWIPDSLAVDPRSIIDLTTRMDAEGRIRGTLPPGRWRIVRIGHTSTGKTNYTGGGALGLECDKFDPEAVRLQFRQWFQAAFDSTDPNLARSVIDFLHIDSWECGSQNWSPQFPDAFKKRRGYDLMPWLLTMTGVPVGSIRRSEQVLHDVRQTIAELVDEKFYATLKLEANKLGCHISAEAMAPTMTGDGMLHYRNVDVPMGEFWYNSPTHDKPNDMFDAVSAAHVYGKPIIQAEAFTTVRMDWSEHPGKLKITGDRNLAFGANRLFLHVFTHNPWTDRRPGMTLDGVGLYYQRDQTWFRPSKAWIDYLSRCQAMLQQGEPVADIAVFTGDDLPRRSVLPDRLVNSLPGLFGVERLASEQRRLRNESQPLRQIPEGVSHSANMADPEDWTDPLRGYKYDAFHPDALLKMEVKNGRVGIPGATTYGCLVFPLRHPMMPDDRAMGLAIARKVLSLLQQGARILMNPDMDHSFEFNDDKDSLLAIMQRIRTFESSGRLLRLPFTGSDLTELGIAPDLRIAGTPGRFAWTHRRSGVADSWFISNQTDQPQSFDGDFRVMDDQPECFDPLSGQIRNLKGEVKQGRTRVKLSLAPGQSLFLVFRSSDGSKPPALAPTTWIGTGVQYQGPWSIRFDTSFGGPRHPIFQDHPQPWTTHPNDSVRYYSGTAIYLNHFELADADPLPTTLRLDSLSDIASVRINGIDCGTIWTAPFKTDISHAVRKGLNRLEIEVTNTWHNRLIYDETLPEDRRLTWTTAPFRLKGKPLLPAGLGAIPVFLRPVKPNPTGY